MMRHEEFETVITMSGLYDDLIYERVLGNLVIYLLNKVENIPEEEFDTKHDIRVKAYYILNYLDKKGCYDRCFEDYPDKDEKVAAKWYKIQIWGSKDDSNICKTFGTYPDIIEWAYSKMNKNDGKALFIKEITREEVLA